MSNPPCRHTAKFILRVIVCLILLSKSTLSFGQAPNITYATPQTYLLNKPIAALQPANTGGPVPAIVYGTTSTLASGLGEPTGIAVDAAGNIYVQEWDYSVITKITPAGVKSHFAGSGANALTDGPANSAAFYYPDALTMDAAGNLYASDYSNYAIRKITPAGFVSTLAGNGSGGSANGTGSAATFYGPRGLCLDAAGNIYVADQANNMIRKITPAGVVTTVAGNGGTGFTNGPALSAMFSSPTGVEFDPSGNMYVSDAGNNAIRKITPAGVVSTFVTGINFPREMRADANGGFYVAEQYGGSIKRISFTGVVTTVVSGFSGPLGMVLDQKGSLFFTDVSSGRVMKVNISGYTIDKTLPAGLSFDSLTGIISGTPTAPSPLTAYTITAFNGGGSSATTVNIEVLTAKPSIITMPTPPGTFDANNNYDPKVTSTNNETPIVLTSSNPAVATITADGLVHAVAPGVTIITANQIGNANYSAAQPVTQKLTITEYLSVNLPAISTKTVCDADFNVNATSGNKSLPITYSSSNTSVATISAQGLVHIVGQGTTTITAYKNGTPPLYVSATPQSKTLTVTLPVLPTAAISAVYDAPCDGSNITFTATIQNGGSAPAYEWQVNGVNAGSNSAVFKSATLLNGDKVTYTVRNTASACLTGFPVTSNIVTVVLTPISAPSVNITASVNDVYADVPITFTAVVKNATGAINYQWQINGIDASNNSTIFTHNNFKDGDKVTCKISSSAPCVTPNVSPAITVRVITRLTIPNTFTPNGDGINDYFNIIGIGNYPNCQVNIYTRYGSTVYQSQGYRTAWDGTFGGKLLPVGTYFYVITDNRLPEKLSGSITIIR